MNRFDIRDIVTILLNSIYNTVGEDGLATGFALGSSSGTHPLGSINITLFFRRKKLLPAAIKLRELGPVHLRYLPLGHCFSLLRNFLCERYHLIACNDIFSRAETSLLERVSHSHIDLLVEEFAKSDILIPDFNTYLFPLVPIQVKSAFNGSSFTFSKNSDLPSQFRCSGYPPGFINGEQFPPFTERNWNTKSPSSWLLVEAPSPDVAKRYRSSILGATSLTVKHRYRYQFTGRKIFGGIASIGNGWTISNSSPHTPALGIDITLSEEDADWLQILDTTLTSTSKSETKKLKSLQYFYRSWFLPDSERFAIDCITIDSMFGDANGATEAVASGVDEIFEGKLDRRRVLLLMRLRNSVIHGGAPDVYDSIKYAKYYRDYGEDPINDMSALVAESLRRKIFNGKLREHSDFFAGVIERATSIGILPAQVHSGILSPLFETDIPRVDT